MINVNATLLVQLIHFLLLVLLMNYLFIRPVKRIMSAREEHFTDVRAEAEGLLGRSAEGEADFDRGLREAMESGQHLVSEAVKESEAAFVSVVEETEGRAQAMLAEVRSDVSGQVSRAREELRGDIDRLAGLMVERVLGRSVGGR